MPGPPSTYGYLHGLIWVGLAKLNDLYQLDTSRAGTLNSELKMTQKQPDAEWLTLLRSKKRLDREKGLNQLKLMVTSSPVEGQCDKIEGELLGLILSLVGPWEERHGGLLAAGIMIQTGAASQKFCEKIKGEIPLFLEDSESRVRMAAGIKQCQVIRAFGCHLGIWSCY